MSEEQENVAEEIQQEEAVQPQEDAQTPEVEAEEEKAHYSKDENFARLRETKQQLERENRELRKLYESKQQKPEEELDVDDDDLVEGKVVKRLYNELKELKKFQQSYEEDKVKSIPERLKNKYSDFDQVVTQENVEKLKETEPELYSSITSGSDLYAKGVSAYKTLRALGIVKDDKYKAQKEEVQNNNSKPVSAQAIRGQGALSDANIFAKGLTPELKKQLQEEMQQAIKAR